MSAGRPEDPREPDEVLAPGESPRGASAAGSSALDPREVARLRALAQLLDAAVEIPGTRIRVGVDALLGLVPGVGDLLSAVFPAYTILHATRRQVPKLVIGRMVANWGIDVLIGTIPLLGDLFDIGWKANLRNVALLERHLERAEAESARRRGTTDPEPSRGAPARSAGPSEPTG